jgi:hypothetical protein
VRARSIGRSAERMARETSLFNMNYIVGRDIFLEHIGLARVFHERLDAHARTSTTLLAINTYCDALVRWSPSPSSMIFETVPTTSSAANCANLPRTKDRRRKTEATTTARHTTWLDVGSECGRFVVDDKSGSLSASWLPLREVIFVSSRGTQCHSSAREHRPT